MKKEKYEKIDKTKSYVDELARFVRFRKPILRGNISSKNQAWRLVQEIILKEFGEDQLIPNTTYKNKNGNIYLQKFNKDTISFSKKIDLGSHRTTFYLRNRPFKKYVIKYEEMIILKEVMVGSKKLMFRRMFKINYKDKRKHIKNILIKRLSEETENE